MMRIKAIPVLLFFILCNAGNLYAYCFKTVITIAKNDTITKKRNQWANVGLGWGFKPNSIYIEGPEVGLNYNWLLKKFTVQANASHIEKFSLNSSKTTSLNTISFNAGKHIMKRYYTTGITIGPGVMWGTIYESNYYYIKYVRPGIATNIMIVFKPIKNFGFGLEAFGYFNNEIRSTGLKFILHFNDKK